jgi:hypothetical protein
MLFFTLLHYNLILAAVFLASMYSITVSYVVLGLTASYEKQRLQKIVPVSTATVEEFSATYKPFLFC